MQNGSVASVKFSHTDHQTDDLASMTILLVEDDAINQLVVKRLLERRGHAGGGPDRPYRPGLPGRFAAAGI